MVKPIEKPYIRLSRFNPKLTFEQYKDLVDEWGIQQYYMATAVNRGIKQYDYLLWKAGELQ
jgi:hypothetical protein